MNDCCLHNNDLIGVEQQYNGAGYIFQVPYYYG